jgi:hypothetical protein
MLVAPIVIQVTLVIIAITSYDPLIALHGIPVIMLIYAGTLLSWIWSMGKNLATKLPAGFTMNATRLRNFLIVPAVYFFLVMLIIETAAAGEINPTYDVLPLYIAGGVLMILLHFFSVFCIFYGIYFVAKSLKSVQLGREAELGEYIGEFFLLWFWFIGVWIIQPKINRLFDQPGESRIV